MKIIHFRCTSALCEHGSSYKEGKPDSIMWLSVAKKYLWKLVHSICGIFVALKHNTSKKRKRGLVECLEFIVQIINYNLQE